MIRVVAKYGVQSVAGVISAWSRPSSKGTTNYEIQLHLDGVLTCNCPGWVKNRTRNCTHVKGLVTEAQRILDGKQKPVWEKPNEKVVEKIVEKIVEKRVYTEQPSIELKTGRRLLRAIPSEEV